MTDIFFRDDGLEHGTVKGYRQEYKLGLDRCEACKKAYSADRLARKKAQKQREQEANEEFDAADAEDVQEISTFPSLARFSNVFVPNPVDYDNFGIIPGLDTVVTEEDIENSELEFDIGPLLPDLNAAQQGACAILIEKNPKLFEHLVFQQLTLMFEMEEDVASHLAQAPFFFGDTDND